MLLHSFPGIGILGMGQPILMVRTLHTFTLLRYQLYRLGEVYLQNGFDPLIQGLAAIYEQNRGAPVVDGFHGEVPISYGNDDFALVSLICAYRLAKDPLLLELLVARVEAQNRLMDEDGWYPASAARSCAASTTWSSCALSTRRNCRSMCATWKPACSGQPPSG